MWNAGKVAYYEKDKIQMTQEQRGGLGDTPENAFVDIHMLC